MKSIKVLCLILALILTVVGCERKITKSLKLGHDIAITGISVLSRGLRDYTVPVVVNIENQGDCGESFDVKLIDVTDGREVGRKSATLPAPGGGGIDGNCDLTFTGESGGRQNFGDWIDVGDVNGDGYDDLLVSATAFEILYSDRPTKYRVIAEKPGQAYLYHGGKGMDNVADKVFTGENVGDAFSSGDISLADMNNDGFDDVIVGARFFNNRGRVYIFHGGRDMDEKPDVIIEAEEGVKKSSFGRGVTVGDVNGDGYNDLVVAAPGFEDGKGRAYLYYGGDPFDTTIDKRFTGEGTPDGFAHKMCARGDVDGDGCDDLLIGTRFWPQFENTGRAYLFYGGPGTTMDETCDLYFDAENAGDQIGSSVNLFDVDNDGFADVLIGARRWNRGQGRVYLYWGSDRATMDNIADMHFDGEVDAKARFGSGCVVGGYVNDDDFGDIVIPAYGYYRSSRQGRAYLYYGNTKASMDTICDRTFTPDGTKNQPQRMRIGDFNGDGYGDVVLGGWEYNNFQGRCWLWYGGSGSSTDVTFYWDTTKFSKGKHSLKAKVGPVAGEKDTADNTVTTEVSVKTP